MRIENHKPKTLTVACRDSALSLLQVKEAFSLFPDIPYRVAAMPSYGDTHKHISLLDDAVPADFFTRELDDVLLRGEADVALHSAKDLPYPLPYGLTLYALLKAQDQTDSLVSVGGRTLLQLPVGARVGTSSPMRKAELLACRPDLQVTGIRGTIEERIAQVDNGQVDALVVATCALKRLGWGHRAAEILPFRTHPLQGKLAIIGKQGREDLRLLFATHDERQHYGNVTLAGFGPGNPDLLTIAADKALREADIIFHDDLLNQDFLSRYAAEKVYVGKRRNAHHYPQDEINEMVYQAATAGKRTLRLKGGDPMIFAHGREEIDFLQSRMVTVDVISGISAAIALAACTHIPLTHRGMASSVAFVTGHAGENSPVPDADTLVYYMGGAHLADIAKKLMASGRRGDLPVALVHSVSLPNQQVFFSTLQELQFSVMKCPTPVIAIFGEVVSFENRDAHRQSVLHTGTVREDSPYTNVTHTPLIKIEPIPENKLLHGSLRTIDTFDWVVFTSRYGVRSFFAAMSELKIDLRALANVRIASVGKTTSAELAKYGCYPDVQPENEAAEGLVAYFKTAPDIGKRLLLPRSDKGLKYLAEELEQAGFQITDIPVYRNLPNPEAQTIDLSPFRKIFFSSPSAVDAFLNLYGKLPEGIPLVAKGESTKLAIVNS